MAQKQTTHDAVSAAMSAIEEALSLSADESPVGAAAPTVSSPDPGSAPDPAPVAPPAPAKTLSAQDPGEPSPIAQRQPPQRGESERILGAGTPPANDDRAAIGPIVQALQSRPSRAPFVAAAVAALVWLALCAAYVVLRLPPTEMNLAAVRDALLRPETLRPETVLLALAALGPTILLFGFATLARRMQELRISAGSITRVALRLAEPETAAGEQVATLSQAIRREVASMGDGVERALTRAAELETLVRSEVSTLESAYSDSERRIRSLIAEMADQREALDHAGAAWSENFEARNAQLRGFVDETASALNGRIEESARQAVAAISDQGAATEDRLHEASQASMARWREQAAQAGEKFASVASEAVASITVSGESLHDALASKIASLEETLGARGGALVADLTAQTGTLDKQMNSLAGLVGDGGDSVVQRISGHATRFGDSLKAQVEAIDAMMSSRQAELDDRLTDHHARFEQASNARLAEFDNASVAHQTVVELALATQASAINDAVRDGMANFETTFAQRSEELISRVNAETDSLTTRIDDKASTIEEAIAARVKALNETLAKNTIEIARGIGGGVDRFRDQVISPLQALSTQFDDAISAHGAALHESIADAADRFGAGLSAQRDEIAATLAAAIENLDAALAGRGDEIAGSLAARIEELRALMTGPEAVDFLTQLSQRGEQVSNEITGVSERAAQTFEYQTSGLIALMKRRSEDLIATITASAADSVHSLGACTGQLRAEVETSTTTLRAAAEVAQSQSSETINQLSSALTGQVETSTTALRAAAEVAQSQSSETINQLLSALTGQIEQSGAALREAIERDAGASVTALTTTSDRLREAVERNAGASVTALTTTSDRLRDELSQVLDRLGEASLALDRVVGGASDTLGAIKGDFSENIDELQRALGAMATQVSELDRMSSTAHSMSGPLIEHMAAYATALTEVSRDFAAKQETANQAFERRHASLQNLFAEIDAKSLDFDTAASRFAASFEESFNRAQARAQEISASLALATKGTASSVISQFEMIRENASKERESTERALQAAYEQANAQLSEVMHDTADRFRQAVAEVKQMAGDVQRHLDATRQELRRGVFELPEETNEAATAMRRVVSDQIKALRELTAVVTASGADFDVAEPAPATAPARFDALRNDAAPRNADSARDDGRALVAAPIAAESARTGAKSQRPRAPQAPASAPPTSPASAERGQSGWLSNLLAAASRDESRTAPGRAGNDPLEGISLDIAKFVDAEAAAEMWDRWRGGDTTAVSRRLYTAQGQQTFDEVRRRFRNDPQFQVSVTRYTQEFERLLAKIGQSDRDGAQSRSTLLSDAGKVYTMLAHASGRLG